MTSLVKKISLAAAALASLASAELVTFSYGGFTYGTMDLSVVNATTVQVQVTSAAAGSIPGVTDYQITGFTFVFEGSPSITVVNPGDAEYANDNNSLDWITLDNMNSIPTSANTGVKKNVWDFGITETNANNINPPGIHQGGNMDIFRLSGFSGLATDADVIAAITLEGIRIQAITGSNVPNGGSLLLTGTPGVIPPTTPAVPEPGTLALMGLGLAGIAFAARRRNK